MCKILGSVSPVFAITVVVVAVVSNPFSVHLILGGKT